MKKKRASSHLSLSLLGSVQVALDGQLRRITSQKGRALLVYLVMERDIAHRREELAELLWPDKAGSQGTDSLPTELDKLRTYIGNDEARPPFLPENRMFLQFDTESQFTVDTDEFVELLDACSRHKHPHIRLCAECNQRLENAVELYRGEFAQDLVLSENDTLQNWLT